MSKGVSHRMRTAKGQSLFIQVGNIWSRKLLAAWRHPGLSMSSVLKSLEV